MNTIFDALSCLNNKKTKQLKPNLLLINNISNVELCYYDQIIARWTVSSFEIVKPNYTPNGKLSKTTVKFINRYCPENMKCSSTNKGTFLYKDGEIVQHLKI